jgi:nicotinamide-nucleotide amidase
MMRETIKIFGLDKMETAARLEEFKADNMRFDISERCLDVSVEMHADMTPLEFGSIKSRIYNKFEEEVYASQKTELHEMAAKLLKINRKTLGIAESLTGGEICSRISAVEGISEIFYEGIVCYNKASKVKRLGVPQSVLDKYGAISRETAYEMVRGITAKPPVDIGVATTGLAGPAGDEGKPVGLVYIGVGAGDFIAVFEKKFKGSRNEIRTASANAALFYLIRYLRGDILRL